MDIGSVDNA